jgi:hypothetical protein
LVAISFAEAKAIVRAAEEATGRSALTRSRMRAGRTPPTGL